MVTIILASYSLGDFPRSHVWQLFHVSSDATQIAKSHRLATGLSRILLVAPPWTSAQAALFNSLYLYDSSQHTNSWYSSCIQVDTFLKFVSVVFWSDSLSKLMAYEYQNEWRTASAVVSVSRHVTSSFILLFLKDLNQISLMAYRDILISTVQSTFS
jgi:hypothetical protein